MKANPCQTRIQSGSSGPCERVVRFYTRLDPYLVLRSRTLFLPPYLYADVIAWQE